MHTNHRGPEPPERLGPYRLDQLLGAGGMGAVWRAWDERLERWVALKQIRADVTLLYGRERLWREARAVARLNHPSIVHVYDLLESADGDWIVMELVEGRTLRRLLEEETTLPPERAVKLCREITEGLAEAHAQGILHRDLKASNVVVTPSGHAKILDFGLAKELPREGGLEAWDLTLSTPGRILGTCYAMSPEQVLGRALDERSDLFSLGSLLYEMLTGEAPFRAETAALSLARVVELKPPSLQGAHPAIPLAVCELVDWLLQKRPHDRPRSAAEVLALLETAAGPASGGAVPTHLPPRPSWLDSPAAKTTLVDTPAHSTDRHVTVGQVFLSYRHVPPDEQLAEGLCAYLQERGIRVFLDKQIRIGLAWAAEIDRQLRASGAFVVFLSEDSIRSDMVRQEVQTAYELWQRGKLAIFPVRLGFRGELPYDLGACLDRIQYVLWQQEDAQEELFALLHAAITGDDSLPEMPLSEDTADTAVLSPSDPAVAAERRGAPLPAADPRIVMETGTIRLDSPFYVRRREDGIAESCLAQAGSTIVVKGPRQSGKSSLLARIHALSKRGGWRSVYLDFQTFDDPQLASLHTVLYTLARRIARSLKTSLQPDDVWDSDLLGEKGSFAEFLVRAVLEGSSSPAVLLLDEVDRLFDHSYRGDFFAAVRGWHNNRATDEAWENLHLVLGHATDPALWIENLNESPFNVGDRLRLGDFTRDQVADLNDRHGKPLSNAEGIDGLMALVGGHPYLVRQALYILATERWSLARLRDEAGKDTGPFGDHLRRHLWALLKHDRLRAAVARIARGEGCDDEGLFQRLQASGLAAGEDRSTARLRCELYQQYFSRHL